MKTRVNYNEISKVYNTRYEGNSLDGIKDFLINTINARMPGTVIEVGCGTAFWLNYFSKNKFRVFGADYSRGMLKVAQSTNNSAKFINADAKYLPFRNSSFEFIYVVNAIHHFDDPLKFINNSYDLLKPGGTLCIIGMEPRESKEKWYLYRYFQQTYKIDLNRFPTFDQLKLEMQNSGFTDISVKLVQTIDKSLTGRQILTDHFADKKGASQLALLSDTEYNIGINSIKSDIETAESNGKQILFEIFLNFYAILCTKPI